MRCETVLNYDNTGFLCKINEFNKHLLLNPHELPCGHILCLNCIFEYYNSVTNDFKCPFEKCKMIHVLKNPLVKLDIIENNLKEICYNQVLFLDIKLKQLGPDYGK